jgi:hypothetical protein
LTRKGGEVTGKDIVVMSRRELKKIKVIQEAIKKHITQLKAGEVLGLSDRQIRRIIRRVRKEGDGGIAHRSRGRRSHYAISRRIKARILKLCGEKYRDFSPTFASEKLEELEGIRVSRETLRKWFIEGEIPYATRKMRPHREWRERKHCCGEMVQVDGSDHDWFEGRGERCVLMGYIDDATGRVFARFYPYEGTMPALDSTRRYIDRHGIPMSIYLDKHQTYRSNREPTIEEELGNIRPLTEYARSVEELGIKVIHAHSPQAKGRVERAFRTFQDRLVKEMRLRGISTIEEANRFLEEYLPRYNKRFTVAPREAADLHRPVPAGINLDRVFSIKTERALRNDFTVAHDRKLYQIKDKVRAKKLTVEERLDGSLVITHKNRELKFEEIVTRPERTRKSSDHSPRHRRVHIPPADHPWRGVKRMSPGLLVASPCQDRVSQVRMDGQT